MTTITIYEDCNNNIYFEELAQENTFAIVGNNEYTPILCEDYNIIREIVNTFYNYNFDDYSKFDFIADIERDYNLQVFTATMIYEYLDSDKFSDCNNDKVYLMSLISKHTYKCKCIAGCSQGDWNYLFYQTDIPIDIDYISDVYFNMCHDLHIENDYDDFWDIITDSNLFKHCCDNSLKQYLASIYDLDINDLQVLMQDGYTTTPRFKTI